MMVKSKVKYIQSLSHKKLRDEDGVFIAEGPKIINELLDTGFIQTLEIFATEEWLRNFEAKHGSLPPGATAVSDDELARISFLTTPNQALGLFRQPVPKKPLLLRGKISLVADGIQDPGNMGTIIRCADWFGIEQVICSKECADAFNPKTVQSSMGSIARVAVFYEDLVAMMLENPGIDSYAATLSGTSLYEIGKIDEGMILVGNESRGISGEILKLATKQATIPRRGHAESLNASVATGILLSHLLR